VADTLHATATAWGKTAVHAKSTPGFIVNRVARPYYAEALRVLHEGGADCATLDAVMREAGGFRMGPFELMDMIGHDVNYAVTCSVWQAYFNDPRYTPSLIQRELTDAGFFGKKSGRGFYDYRAGAEKPAAQQEAKQALPAKVEICGDSPAAQALAQRLGAASVSVTRAASSDAHIAQAGGAVCVSPMAAAPPAARLRPKRQYGADRPGAGLPQSHPAGDQCCRAMRPASGSGCHRRVAGRGLCRVAPA
jgi:3-hydroxybutyryl-CoA dehydrogenase